MDYYLLSCGNSTILYEKGNEFNLVDEVIGIGEDEYLNRKKYMIKNTEYGEVISQYGSNYRKATKE